MKSFPGEASRQAHGFYYSHKWLILRRISQVFILLLFIAGPLMSVWVIKGNLSSSLLLNTVPLSDPYVLAQIALAGHLPEFNALLGVILVIGFYLVVGGRVFCSWVCPVNLLTDLAAWLRRKFRLNPDVKITRNLRYILLAITLVVPLFISIVAWELINPVSIFHRGLIFGFGYGFLLLLAIFCFDLFVMRHGWCGHICPMGAFYAIINRFSLVKVSAVNREQCNDCGDCYLICPEPHVLRPALKRAEKNNTPLITSQDCSNCGRCIDVCEPKVFKFSTKWYKQ
jgi:ferredoxin-type protein NapH